MAKLKIYSDIVDEECKAFMSWAGLSGMSFLDIDKFIDSIPEDDGDIHLTINCRGGMTDQALAMYDALRATGKVISAEVIGECSSSATLLLLSARADLRKAHPNASILIHNPYISGFVEGDAKQIGNIADSLEDVRNQFLDIYVDRTGADREVLSAMMDENKPMSVSKAIELGFIAEEIVPISAQNKQPILIDKKMSFKEKLDNAIKAFKDAFSTFSMSLETADGKTLELEKESGEPVVGDVVLSGDDEYLMPDGSTIVVEGGVIVEIRPAEEVVEETEEERREETDTDLEEDADLSEKDAEIDRLKAEIAEKDAEIDRLRQELEDAKANAKSDTDNEVLNMVNNAGGIEWLKKFQSKGKIDKRTTQSNNLEKAEAKKTEKLTFAEYRKRKAEKKAQSTK
ncbi:MAG: ATP-dependent Clp protease proteolytic subunit [Muribaculaceae bacterium]|nr:ATP-dependent Clp protease proteolytic subunit [Muribaculaceae bacterium]